LRRCVTGLLTDRRVERNDLPQNDRMRDSQFDRFYDQLAKLQNELPKEPESWTSFALRFVLSDPRIVSTVVGINNSEQLRGVVEAVEEGPLDEKVFQKAYEICRDFRNRFGVKANPSGVPVY
jgi:aryl-alcohol dehydrogenase-like predicted oxidoreductase